MKKQLIFLGLIILSGISGPALAQEYNKPALDSLAASRQVSNFKAAKFLLTGYTQTTLMYVPDKDFTISALNFVPIFLWRPTEKIFFEGELEVALDKGVTMIGLEYANINYIVNRYMIFRVGKFLTPFGAFQDRLHPAWINRMPTRPLGFEEDGTTMPTTEIGVAINGGIPIGPSKINYSLYASNGPQLNTGEVTPGKEGTLLYANAEDNNINKALGGRVGYLPFSNSSLEIGGSFQTSKVGMKGTQYENVRATLLALDLTYVKQLPFLKGAIQVLSQWNSVEVGNAAYTDWKGDPTGNTPYTYNNKRSAMYSQIAYRPTLSKKRIIKNLELVYRYGKLEQPEGSKQSGQIKQSMYGLNYWINFRSVMKLAVQSQEGETAYFAQWALLF